MVKYEPMYRRCCRATSGRKLTGGRPQMRSVVVGGNLMDYTSGIGPGTLPLPLG
jgi:hypothetical protein